MADKSRLITTYYVTRKRNERSSGGSSPETEKPSSKSVKTFNMNATEMSDIWEVLNNIQLNNIKDNTNKLLEENRTIREQYQELTKSLEFHVAKIEKPEEEKIALKKEVASLTKVLRETNKHVDEMYEDLATATTVNLRHA